ncbi:MAG: response regulator transcription factor [Anaerolineae bacterium]|nr:response regulator transcription factor [Anaerolineae bacterium]
MENIPGALILLIPLASGIFLFLIVLATRHFSRPKPVKSFPRPPLNPPDAFSNSARPSPFRNVPSPSDLATGSVFVHTALAPPTQAQQNAWDKLPPRQKQAAVLIASGLSTRQVADAMHIQISTVQGYLKETYAALHVRSRAELVNFVRDISLEPPSPPHRIKPP